MIEHEHSEWNFRGCSGVQRKLATHRQHRHCALLRIERVVSAIDSMTMSAPTPVQLPATTSTEMVGWAVFNLFPNQLRCQMNDLLLSMIVESAWVHRL